MTISRKQSFGNNPTAVRKTDHYKYEYVKSFVEKWDDLIDWDSRAKSEGSFFIDQLRERGARRVLDVATGTGYHSVQLLEAGFEVTSVDGSPEMLAKAFENARQRGHILRTVHADWRWLNRDLHEMFDAIICLGNSFTHLFTERDRRKALAEFYATLNHDGILILDQRNYDAILDHGFSSKHKYYYCGENVVAEPEHVDTGLARFQYRFPDNSLYHLNMFPLRKDYSRRLMMEVGFQKVETYGDFQETYHESEPDFFIHVAEKHYDLHEEEIPHEIVYEGAVSVARDYYNSADADNFYHIVWGGEDIHIGLYRSNDEPIFDASRRTVEEMANRAAKLDQDSLVLDIGAGYGGSARYLAKHFGCRLVVLNLSEVENQRGRQKNREQGLDHLVEVVDGSFEKLPYPDKRFDVVWSQDAILHSSDRMRVIAEAARVLKPGGDLIFTDPMQADECPEGVLDPILERIHLESLGSPAFYREAARRLGLEEMSFDERPEQLVRHYSQVLAETERRKADLKGHVSPEYIERMKKGLHHWIEGGKIGYLTWGIFHFRKPAA